MTQSEASAATIAQESFLSAYLRLGEFRNEAEFTAKVYWVASTHASIKLRRERWAQAAEQQIEPPKLPPHDGSAHYPDWSRVANDEPLKADLRRTIEDATDRLPESHREIFLLKDLAGLGYDEILGITGDSIPAIKRRLHQARLSLHEAIDRFYSAKGRDARSKVDLL